MAHAAAAKTEARQWACAWRWEMMWGTECIAWRYVIHSCARWVWCAEIAILLKWRCIIRLKQWTGIWTLQTKDTVVRAMLGSTHAGGRWWWVGWRKSSEICSLITSDFSCSHSTLPFMHTRSYCLHNCRVYMCSIHIHLQLPMHIHLIFLLHIHRSLFLASYAILVFLHLFFIIHIRIDLDVSKRESCLSTSGLNPWHKFPLNIPLY